jgi:hypothetical protein
MQQIVIELPTSPTLDCPTGSFPNYGNLTEYMKSLARVPSQIALQAEALALNELTSISETISKYVKDITSFGADIYRTLDITEQEMEYKARELMLDFKVYVLSSMIDILSVVLPIDLFSIPIPFLNGLYISDFFTKEGRQKIKDYIAENIEDLKGLTDYFTGQWSIISGEHAAQEIYLEIQVKVQNILNNFLLSIIDKIIDIAKPISLIAPLFIDPIGFFDNIYGSIKREAIDLINKGIYTVDQAMDNMINSLLAIEIPFLGISLMDLLKIDLDDELKKSTVEMKELTLAKIVSALKDFLIKVQFNIYELWFEAVKDVLELIPVVSQILDKLFQFIQYPICAFLEIVCLPLFAAFATIDSFFPDYVSINRSSAGYI